MSLEFHTIQLLMIIGQFKMQHFESRYNMSPERFKNEDLFFGAHLYNVSWTIVFKEVAPLLASERRDFILTIAATSTINPVTILSWLTIGNKIDNEGSDEKFRQDVKVFAEELLTQYMDSSGMGNSDTNNGALTLLKVLGDDYDRLDRFLAVYSYIMQQNVGKQNGYDLDRSLAFNERHQKTKQQEQELEETLMLPYPVGECWNIGKIF